MKLHKIEIENIKSFRDKETIEFKDGLNIFIGPNAGGKSNLMDIINASLKNFFIQFWTLIKDDSTGSGYSFNQPHHAFKPIPSFFDRHYDDVGKKVPQQIIVELKLGQEDIENLEALRTNLEKLHNFAFDEYKYGALKKEFNFLWPMNALESLKNVQLNKESLTFKINPVSGITDIDSVAKQYLVFLQRHEMLSILIDQYNLKHGKTTAIKKLYPPLLYFSPIRTLAPEAFKPVLKDKTIYAHTEDYRKKTSQDASAVTNCACDYFAEKMRKYGDDSKRFSEDDEVKDLNEYVKKLGYTEFSLDCKDLRDNVYEVILRGLHRKINIVATSSGEKEILNLLLGIIAFNVRNGLIIIDEPDLHLHPRWQKILLDMLDGLAKTLGIQFLIITHSPHFITPETIGNTFLVHKKDETSKVVAPQNAQAIKDIVQIVHATNNEKLFFADKVILVEGDSDRIIYDKILNILVDAKEKEKEKEKEKIREGNLVEIVDVKGKGNFEKFRGFLQSWHIANYIVADLDYAEKICTDEEVKKLFKLDDKIIEKSAEKGSKDGKTLCDALESILKNRGNGIDEKEWKSLETVWKYIKNRHLKIDENNKSNKALTKFIDEQKKEKIFILKKGEIENYFSGIGKTHFDIDDAVKAAESLTNENLNKELKEIFENILVDQLDK